MQYKATRKLNWEDVYTDSECEGESRLNQNLLISESIIEEDISQVVTCDKLNNTEYKNIVGPNSVHPYKIGNHVLVQFPVGNKEYRYVAIVNQIDKEEGELTVTFMKICDNTGHTFKVDEDDVSDVSFEQILEKLPNPNLVLKGKRIFNFFKSSVPVFEKKVKTVKTDFALKS
ncbi:hypothetical protein RN001_002785 [Aquatica leii]|uniref:Uncharacterized protein n=1 Tax=Aquatica leii TaxID=1421715 RepID=A0AAN7SLZ8_9COLE|nr:hypothetical protein RN001_002785 [Aquatica leii]